MAPGLDDRLHIHHLELERRERAGDTARQRTGTQFRLAARGDGRQPHQIFDILLVVGLDPHMLVRLRDQRGETVNVGGQFGNAEDEGVSDEADLVEPVRHLSDSGHVVEDEVSVGAGIGIDKAMGAGAGAHDEATIGPRQMNVACRCLAAQDDVLGRGRKRLFDQLARQAEPVAVAACRRARRLQRVGALRVHDHDAVTVQQIEGAGLQPRDGIIVDKREARARRRIGERKGVQSRGLPHRRHSPAAPSTLEFPCAFHGRPLRSRAIILPWRLGIWLTAAQLRATERRTKTPAVRGRAGGRRRSRCWPAGRRWSSARPRRAPG